MLVYELREGAARLRGREQNLGDPHYLIRAIPAKGDPLVDRYASTARRTLAGQRDRRLEGRR